MTAMLVALVALAGCASSQEEPELTWIVIEAPTGADVESASFSPSPRVSRRSELAPGLWAIGIDHESLRRGARLDVPGTCTATLDAETERVVLDPWIDVEPHVPQVGYDAPFRIEVRPGCREATSGSIAWTHADGASPGELQTERRGFVVHGRTPPLEGELPWGIVPISPRTRGSIVLEATWTGRDRGAVTKRVIVSAAPRATGLPSVPVGGRVYLGGEGWTIGERPRTGDAALVHQGSHTWLEPDVIGTYQLRDGAGTELLLRVGRYDDTPLDCGRSDCHQGASARAATSPMTSILARGLEGGLGEGYDARCAIGCHTVGEPGLADGGFAHVMRTAGFALPGRPHAHAWDALPVALQRLGGVGCVTCHGPGAIPAPESRWAILRSGVCATCHDAPSRYGHVAAWQASKMSRSDEDARTRADARCRSCHTTSGFLARIGVRDEEHPPAGVGPIGIACAACHAPHGEHVGVSLLRRVQVAESVSRLPDRSRICASCHAPIEDDALPSASAAVLLLADNGEHRAVEGGCIGCHRAGPDGLERGATHAFAVDPQSCAPCHEEPVFARSRASSLALRTRAQTLWDALVARGIVRAGSGDDDDPLHARGPTLTDPASPLASTARNVALVLEDPAAGAHAPGYASALLDEAEAALSGPAR